MKIFNNACLEQLSMNYCYVDRVVVSIYDFVISTLSYHDWQLIVNYLNKELFRAVAKYECFVKLVPRKHRQFRGHADFRYDSNRRIAKFTLNIEYNPTRIVLKNHNTDNGYVSDESYDGQDNYFPIEFVRIHGNRKLHDLCVTHYYCMPCNILNEIKTVIYKCVSNSDSICFSSPKCSIQDVEVYWDLPCSASINKVASIREPFKSAFRCLDEKKYNSYFISEESIINSICLKGQRRKSEFYKVYAKTPNLIRFESNFKREKIKSICGSNVLPDLSLDSVNAILDPLVKRTLETWQIVMNDYSVPAKQFCKSRLLFDFIRQFNTFDDLSSIISLIDNSGRVCSQQRLYYLISKLRDTHFLVKVDRGVYQPSPKLMAIIDYFSEEQESMPLSGADICNCGTIGYKHNA